VPRRALGPPGLIGVLAVLLAVLLVPACSVSARHRAAGARIEVAAAESTWGSIAAQLGGSRVEVASLISSPETDPHDYEPTAADARTIAQAQVVIENGLGYDPWVSRLVAANATPGQVVIDVGKLLGLHAGDNPHRWYFPDDVQRVIERIAQVYRTTDPAHAAEFASRQRTFEHVGLAEYHALLAEIRQRYGGTPVGASESIFEGVARATGLRLLTPSTYLRAISEGTEPTASDTATVDAQIRTGRIAVWVFNSQNATPDVDEQTAAARRRGVPVTTVTETLVPIGTTFQSWQVRQLRALADALARAQGT
jgi:zinc/manganese transport system substrate-binding protein